MKNNHDDLVTGDQFLLFEKEPLKAEDGSDLAVGGLVARWFDLDKPGKVFKVKNITKTTEAVLKRGDSPEVWHYWCTYLGELIQREGEEQPSVIDSNGIAVGADHSGY